MAQVWLITIPNNKEKATNVYNTVASAIESKGSTQSFRFEIPELPTGTLDTLMALSDDLTKIGSQVENVVRKIERQYLDIAGQNPKPLDVNGRAVGVSVQRFQWDFASYAPSNSLPALVSMIQSKAGSAEEELKTLSTAYADKNLALGNAKRRKVVNMTSSDFEDFVTPEEMARVEIFNTESLLTVAVAVPKALENEFKAGYYTIGNEIAAYGGPDWSSSEAVGGADDKFGPKLKRTSVRGSPVVPKSAKLIKDDGDYCLYAVTILRGHYTAGYFTDGVFTNGSFVDYLEPLRVAFREKRFTLREIVYDQAKAGSIDSAIREAKQDLTQSKNTLVQWCRAHFGDIFNAWLHLKVVQAFVESILRYGVPMDFVPFFVIPDMKLEKELKTQLLRTVLNLRPELRPRKALAQEEEEEVAEGEALPYVYVKFSLVGAVSSTA
jgi:V-type H+-transporting ATPase subunit C